MEGRQHRHTCIRLLGSVQVERDGLPMQGFESLKTLALLGYLAVCGHPVSREKLIGLFWGEKTETRGRGNLRRVLHNLNQIMPGCLEADRYIIRWKSSPNCQSDTELFIHLMEQSNTSALAQAIALYRGDFMEGLYLNDCPEFENWLFIEQERWRQRAARTFTRLIDQYTRRGEYAQALDAAQQLLTLTPWRESTHRQIMGLLARTGQRGEALRQYNICRRMLADEFGVEPSNETQALYRRIRAAEARPRFALPAQLTSFVGRKRELAEISRLLASPDCRLLTLVGWGGVGKTRLALRYAEKNPDAFLDGTVFVPLVGVQDANHLFLSIAQALNFSLVAAPEPRLQVFEYLRAKEMLLILDNFEHLIAESAAALTDLLAAAPHVKLLVTSRERLNRREEWVFRLEGLSLPHPRGADSPPEERQTAPNQGEAILLFEQRARQADHRFVPDAHIRQICTLLAGHPLGIELSAALTAYLSPREISEHLRTHLDMPVPPAQNTPARHRSLHIVIESSLDTLSEGERAAFRDLTVFQGGFSLDAARQVVGATPQVLAALTGKSLLRQSGNGRYEMHPVLQRYGREMRARAPRHNHRLQRAHSRYFADFLFQRRRVSRGDVKTDNEIKHELENIRQAWRWAVEHIEAALIGKAADALGMFYYLRGWYEAGERDYRTAIERLRRSTPRGAKTGEVEDALARVLGWQGEFALNRGEYAAAQELLEESVALFQTLGCPSETAWRMLSLGMSVMHQGNLSLAERYYQDSLSAFTAEESSSAFTAAENLNGAAICTEFIGTAAAIRGDYPQAQQHYRESLQLYRRVGDVYGEAGGLYCLGDIARITGDYAEAQRRFAASLEAYQSIHNQRGAAQAYNQLGNIARLLHEYGQAADYHRQSLWLRREIGEQDGVATSITNLGVDAYCAGDYPRARAHCAAGLAIFRELKHRRGIVFALIHLGKAQAALGEYPQAKETLREALQIAIRVESSPQVMESLAAIAALLADTGEGERAAAVLALPLESAATYREVRDEARELARRLQAELPAEEFDRALARGRYRDPNAVLAELA